MAISSHSGSCDHGCGDQCCRQQFQLSHSSSPFVKSQYHLAPRVAGLLPAIVERQGRQDGFAIPHQLETRQAINLFGRTSLAGTSISIDDPTSREHRFTITLPLAVAATVVTL